ncbi:MAG: hypothetical protein V3R82_00325 [Candidatus Hydrothermarchaeales archaeon]
MSTNTRLSDERIKNLNIGFMRMWSALGKKKQMNLPLTNEMKKIIDREGGSEFVLKTILKELEKEGKLPDDYKIFLTY